MLIQEFACPDSIVAYRLVLVEFCNRIGTKLPCQRIRRMSGIGAEPDMTRAFRDVAV